MIHWIAHIIVDKFFYYKKVPLFCWFDHFLVSRAEMRQSFRWFFEKSMTPKKHSEINWPLSLLHCKCMKSDLKLTILIYSFRSSKLLRSPNQFRLRLYRKRPLLNNSNNSPKRKTKRNKRPRMNWIYSPKPPLKT